MLHDPRPVGCGVGELKVPEFRREESGGFALDAGEGTEYEGGGKLQHARNSLPANEGGRFGLRRNLPVEGIDYDKAGSADF